jgi:hypothetical protein
MIISRRRGLIGLVERTGKMRNSYNNLVGKPEEKRPLAGRKYRRGYIHNSPIKLILKCVLLD